MIKELQQIKEHTESLSKIAQECVKTLSIIDEVIEANSGLTAESKLAAIKLIIQITTRKVISYG